jgi:beta-lactamase regulating signal transducer with metallopeptidase domain/HEAT repeat protein
MTAAQALGWALVHSLWHFTLAAAALAVLFRIVPARAARLRYTLAIATLGLMLALPLFTTLRLYGAAPTAVVRDLAVSAVERTISAPPLGARVRTTLEPALPWLVVLWLGGVLVSSLRLASGWQAARRLLLVGTRPASPTCAEAVARLAARMRVTRPVRIVESALVQVPAVIGWLRPVILLPASALTGLTPQQLEALLAHELAHVRRYDYLVHLIQSVTETLLFYHPAVWWVSGRVREEREHCCDDLAVAACGDARTYAMALFSLERLRVSQPAFALGVDGGGSLLRRIRRLLAPAGPAVFAPWRAGVLAVMLALAIGGGAGLAGAFTRHPREDVRQEAAETLRSRADGPGRAALLDLARTHPNPDIRREAIETLEEPALPDGGLERLAEIVRRDAVAEVQRKAVDVIGRLRDPRAYGLLVEFARHHPVSQVRQEAVEELGRLEGSDPPAAVLEAIAREEPDVKVQKEAVEALGRKRAFEALSRLAQSHPSEDVRRRALDEYAEGTVPEAALALLRDRLTKDRSLQVQGEALEELAELPGGTGIPTIIEAAWTHPSQLLRDEARLRLLTQSR